MRDKNAIQESQMLRLVDGGVDFEELRKEKKLPFNNGPWQRFARSSSAVAELEKDIADVEQEEDGDVTKAARLEDLQKKLRIAETSKSENAKAVQTASNNKPHNKAKWAKKEVEGLEDQLKSEVDLTEEDRSKLQELLKMAKDYAKTAKDAAQTTSEKMSTSDVYNTAKRAKKEVEGLKKQVKKEVDLTEEGRSKLQELLKTAEDKAKTAKEAAKTKSKNKSTSDVYNTAKRAKKEVEGLKKQVKKEVDLTEEGRSKLQEQLKKAKDKAKRAEEAAKTKSEKASKSLKKVQVHNKARWAEEEVEGLEDQLKSEVDLTEEDRSKLQELLKTAEDKAKTAKEAATLRSLSLSVGGMRRLYNKEKNKTPDNIPLGEVIHKITQDFKKKELDKAVATEATFVKAQADRDTLVSSLAGDLSNLPDADEHKQNTLQQLLKAKSVLKTIAESLNAKEKRKLSRKRASDLKEEISNTIKKAKNSA
ncbi:hypothetical protein TrCOL_g5792 [Triparma columacea]|uniref:Uncharacterized protein n=1 Tax=Triparma columacea TaxID=722753 RepID=A0A9W7L4F9_9STRA|nr:hypothetical protein TrCOL_g5792 [Triparma columacea]